MEENIRNNAMRFVFKYLSYADLENMSLVCRSWLKLIEKENLLKCSKFTTGQLIKIRKNIIITEDHVFNSTDSKPHLLLFFTNQDSNSSIIEKFYTQLMPTYCYRAILKRNDFEDENILWSIIIPYTSKIQLVALTFARRFFMPGFCCLETCHFFDLHFEEYHEMKTYYESFIHNAPSNSCIILLCEHNNIPHLLNMVTQLAIWYPGMGPVWGATLNSVNVCSRLWYAPANSSRANIIQIFISGQDMLVRYLVLDENYNTKEKIQEKFQCLRDTVKLRENSIAFLCTPIARYKDFYEIESTLFKEIFPKVTLAQIFSKKPFGANNLNEFHKYLINFAPHVGNNNTTCLLISYNN